MKVVEAVPNIDFGGNKHLEARQKEIKAFWDSGAKYAEMTVFNPNTKTQTEVKHYEKAARRMRLGMYDIDFCQRKGKVYAMRLKDGGNE